MVQHKLGHKQRRSDDARDATGLRPQSHERSKEDQPPQASVAPSTSTSIGTTGRLTGQGSHFPQDDVPRGPDTTNYLPGTDVKHHAPVTATTASHGTGGAPASGTAAIGHTSTYSSHPLAHGDPVGSVADPTSSDPTTFKMPEHSYAAATGVPSGAAGTAASLAFHKDKDASTSNIPGAYPKDDSTSAAAPSGAPRGTLAGSAATTAAGAGTAGLASDPGATTAPPASATTTVDPTARSAADHGAATTNVPGHDVLGSTNTASSTTPTTAESSHRSGTLGKILGAVGLGGAAAGAGTAAAKSDTDRPTAVAATPDHPTTTNTGVDSYAAPTQSGPQVGHHRKESIPTTAYPAGPSSPSPINAPIGGTSHAAPETGQKDRAGHHAGLAAAGAGAGVGAAAVGAHEYGKETPRDHSQLQPSAVSGAPSGLTHASGESQVLGGQKDVAYRGVPETESDGGAARGKTAAAAGAGVGAGAAGAYELQHDKHAPTATAGAAGIPSQTQPTTDGTLGSPSQTQPRGVEEKESDRGAGHGKTAAAAGAGVGAGAAGAYALQHEKESPSATAGAVGLSSQTQPTTAGTLGTSSQTQSARQAENVKATTPSHPTRADPAPKDHSAVPGQRKEESHTGRDAALVGSAGVGAGAYGVHELNKHQTDDEASKLAARREKDLAEQEAARRKQFEKDQKAAEKQAAKDEKHHQKELQKEEKAREKAVAKEEKKHQKEIEKEEHQRQKSIEMEEHERTVAAAAAHKERREREEKQRREAEEVEKKSHEKELAAAAAVGTGAVAGGTAAYVAHDPEAPKAATATGETTRPSESGSDRNRLHKEPTHEKKANIFKRIFKRRKNKDTGEEEEYSTDEEDTGHHDHHAAEAGAAGTAAVVGGAAMLRHPDKHTESRYEAESGGMQKPSYNPFHKDDPTTVTGTSATGNLAKEPHTQPSAGLTDSTRAAHATTAPTETTAHQTGISGPAGTARLHEGSHPDDRAGVTGSGPGADSDIRPHESITGLPYDPAKDPETAERLDQHQSLGHRILEQLKPLHEKPAPSSTH